MTDDLKLAELSAAATQGVWKLDWSVDHEFRGVYPATDRKEFPIAKLPEYMRDEVTGVDGAFIVALANAYRAGHLVPASPEIAQLREALTDMLSGWEYIRSHHGDLYGVGWDRCAQAAISALDKAAPHD